MSLGPEDVERVTRLQIRDLRERATLGEVNYLGVFILAAFVCEEGRTLKVIIADHPDKSEADVKAEMAGEWKAFGKRMRGEW